VYIYRGTETGKLSPAPLENVKGSFIARLKREGPGLYAVVGGREGIAWYSVEEEMVPTLRVRRVGPEMGPEKA